MLRRLPLFALVILTLSLGFLSGPAAAEDLKTTPAAPRDVDFVICLDTSGSMSGLIHAARQKLWSVVSEIATLKPEPRLRVALLTYGTPGHPERGDVIIQTDLTTDLDLVSEKLFALGTNGGTELVGRVLHYALKDLSWSRHAGLKTIFVAGNESADQDKQMPFIAMAQTAQTHGIFVNAIYCGGADDGDAASWRQLSAAGAGKFSHIDHNRGTVSIQTPFDKELSELSTRLNGTYLFYGVARIELRKRQKVQDANAVQAGAPAAAQRAEAKASSQYRAPNDLVEKAKDANFKLDKLATEELPEAMQKMTPEQRKAHVAKNTKERAAVQLRIQALSKKRAAFVQRVMSEKKLDDSLSLDRALREAVREQAEKKGFKAPAK